MNLFRMKHITLIGTFAIMSFFSSPSLASNNTLNNLNYVLTSDTSDTSAIKIPNVFSPNRDGINDLFKPTGNFSALSMKIYNRYGELIYTSSQLNEGWNGRTTAGATCSEGTYFYIIETEKETFTGSLTLLR